MIELEIETFDIWCLRSEGMYSDCRDLSPRAIRSRMALARALGAFHGQVFLALCRRGILK